MATDIRTMETEKAKVFAAIANVHGYAVDKLPKDRASAIVLTKLDEAMLWLMHGNIGSAVEVAMAKNKATMEEIKKKAMEEVEKEGVQTDAK